MGASNNVWSRINRLLIVVKFEEMDTIFEWRNAIKNTGLNIHDCQILAVVDTKKERQILREMNSVAFISEGDYNFFGKLKNENAQRVLSDSFDAIIFEGECSKKVKKSVMKVRCSIDIGLNTNNDQRTINLGTEETAPKYMLNFVKQTLEKIS